MLVLHVRLHVLMDVYHVETLAVPHVVQLVDLYVLQDVTEPVLDVQQHVKRSVLQFVHRIVLVHVMVAAAEFVLDAVVVARHHVLEIICHLRGQEILIVAIIAVDLAILVVTPLVAELVAADVPKDVRVVMPAVAAHVMVVLPHVVEIAKQLVQILVLKHVLIIVVPRVVSTDVHHVQIPVGQTDAQVLVT